MLPHHRDVIAAHCVESFVGASESRIDMSSIGGLLRVLAEADGPIGVGMNLVVSYGLNAKTAESRRYAVDALVVLAARGQVPAMELGRTLATLVNRRAVIVSRIVDGLRATAQLGAAEEIWEVLAAMIGDVLLQPTAPTGLAELIGLAAEVAERVRPRADIPGLAAMAATRGKSRQLTEARRLSRLLEPEG